jgi:dipeptidyl aminopeptidase/acylaminoacyl peptidase
MERPYGTWPSAFTAARVAAQSVRLMAVSVEGDTIHWLERRPGEGGRVVLVRREPDGTCRDLTPGWFNARTRVNEYGGGAHLVSGDTVWASHFDDQRLYRIDAAGVVPLTPAGPYCYADAVLDRRRRRLVAVREDHTPGDQEAITTLVAVPLDEGDHPGIVLASGADFYAAPRLSPDGSRLAWLSWRHPSMPWDGTELWVADLTPDGELPDAVCVAGGTDESVYQPGWAPSGDLYFVSDRSGWWQVYRCRLAGDAQPRIEAVVRNPPPEAEFGQPQWLLGTSTWACAGDDRLVVAYTRAGRWYLGVVDLATGRMRDLAAGWEPGGWVVATATHAVAVAGSAETSEAVVCVEIDSGACTVVRAASDDRPDPAAVSHPQAMACPGLDEGAVHFFYYPPAHPDCVAPPAERPPLIVVAHGGPTGAASATFDPRVQFWTSRGFAVADVNYRGSTGYGRAYRTALDGQWGVLDVGDLVAVARHLVEAGRADPARLIIRGGSAGGYAALAALAFHPGIFAAAASYYGVSDLEVLARDTHKFESRYLERLVGPWPDARDLYRARSPIHAADRIACRLILFQGLDDRIVPPNQSEMMARAVRANGWPVAYLAFEGEQHGFRRAETIARCLEAELYFYGVVFGFAPADPLEPVPIDRA